MELSPEDLVPVTCPKMTVPLLEACVMTKAVLLLIAKDMHKFVPERDVHTLVCPMNTASQVVLMPVEICILPSHPAAAPAAVNQMLSPAAIMEFTAAVPCIPDGYCSSQPPSILRLMAYAG